jgi:outer membrane autotransporter protein
MVDVIETPGAPGGLVIGTFTTVNTSEFKGLVQPTVFYDKPGDVNAFGVPVGDGDSDAVIVDFELTHTFLSQALTRNQRAVAEDMDDTVGDPRTAQLLGFLGALPPGLLPHAFDLIAPEELASIYEVRFSSAVQRDQNLERRMDDIRAGANGFCGAGFAPQVAGPAYSKDSGGKAVLDKNPAPAFVPTPENPWGIWVTGQGEYINVGHDDDNAEGYDLNSGGVTGGVDYRIMQHLAIGVFGAYDSGRGTLVGQSDIGQGGHAAGGPQGTHGRLTIDTGTIGGYATFNWAGFYVDAAGSGGWSNFDTNRVALNGFAKGTSDGTEYNALVALGYDWRFGCLNVGPTATFQYTDVQINQYSERGSLAPLTIEDQDEDSLRSTVGVRASYDWKVGSKGVILRPEVRAAWLHEYNDQAYPIRSHLASGAGDSFTVFGPEMGRDAAQIGAGVTVHYNPSWSMFLAYDGVLGRGNYDANGASGGVTFSF